MKFTARTYQPQHTFRKGDTAFELSVSADRGSVSDCAGSFRVEELVITSWGARQGTATVAGTNLKRRLYRSFSLVCRTRD